MCPSASQLLKDCDWPGCKSSPSGDTASTRELSENSVNGLVAEILPRDAQVAVTPRDLKEFCDWSDYRSLPELLSPVAPWSSNVCAPPWRI